MDIISELRDRNHKSDLGDNLCARAAKEIERLRAGLEFYADHNTYCGEEPPAIEDFGHRAREALGGHQQQPNKEG